jgi:hypothetical protein
MAGFAVESLKVEEQSDDYKVIMYGIHRANTGG